MLWSLNLLHSTHPILRWWNNHLDQVLNCRLAELQYCLTTSTEDVLVWDPDVVISMMVGSTVPGYVLLISHTKYWMLLVTAWNCYLVVDSFMVNDGQVCIFLLPRVASKFGWTLVTYPSNCNLPSLNQTLPILVWLYIRGSRGCVYIGRCMHSLVLLPCQCSYWAQKNWWGGCYCNAPLWCSHPAPSEM